MGEGITHCTVPGGARGCPISPSWVLPPPPGMQQQEDLSTQYRSITYALGAQQQAAGRCTGR